jgi:hypothetical protein
MHGSTLGAGGRIGVLACGAVLLSSCGSGGGGSGGSGTPGNDILHVQPATPGETPTHQVLTPISANPSNSAVVWSISPIDAIFSQDCFCTDYAIGISAESGVVPENNVWTVKWTLQLVLVDSAGAPDPTVAGSGAAEDSGCNNNGTGVSSPVVQMTPPSGQEHFTWYHPDPSNAPPGFAAGVFHCDHRLQGPSGHQGVIYVQVDHGAQRCTAEYSGTRSGTGQVPSCYRKP